MNKEIILEQLEVLCENDYLITVLSNTSSLIMQELDNLNWVGYYLFHDGQLILGPFQGLPACETIALDQGVCGASASSEKTIIVDDVHEFEGHIACDSNSNSEMVIPIVVGDQLFGVLDIDSPVFNRFGKLEKELLEEFVAYLQTQIPYKKVSYLP